MAACAVILVRSHYLRRAPAARRMAARGYAVPAISQLLGLSRRRVEDALADVAVNGRIWTARERDALAREFRSAA